MWTSDSLIPGIIVIIFAAGFIAFVILSFVNAHRLNTGKEPLFKGKVRKIVIVYKRVTEHVYFNEDYGFWRTHRPENTESDPAGIAQETSVDFRKVGGKILYTKSIDEELFEQLDVGNTYKVRIRSGCIDKIFERIYM